ncbi:MAG TPA: hypothetical protein VIC03_14060 [Gemmatimonadaceae bacterium]
MILTRWSFSRIAAAAAVAAITVLVIGGCAEKLDGSAGCPLTCADQSVQISTVTLDAVSLDSTVLGGLGRGTEPQMLLANRGDTLDTRVIIRFDSLPSTSRTSATATAVPIAYLDSAILTLQIDSAAINVGAPVTMSIYDVDDSTAVDDTSASVLAPLFTPSRLITSIQFAAGQVVDSLKIPLPKAFLLAKAQARARLRLGLQVSALNKSVEFRVFGQESGFGAVLATRTSPDTSVAPVIMSPYSVTPTNNASIAKSLGDFTIVVKGTPPPPPGTLTIGGLPGTRAYLRFNIPPAISDSSLVIAATLILTQQPSPSPDPTDSMFIQPVLVLAGPTVTDPIRAAQITAPITVLGLAPLKTAPGDSGVREVQIGPAFRYWSIQTAAQLPRAIVLQSSTEDYSAQQALFYSSSAIPALRPKLRISYTPRSRVGVP